MKKILLVGAFVLSSLLMSAGCSYDEDHERRGYDRDRSGYWYEGSRDRDRDRGTYEGPQYPREAYPEQMR